jgi:TetR/AcrR family transcriptional regulator
MPEEKLNLKDKRNNARSSILKTAQELFAQKGFAGTSMSSIASKAEVSHGLLFHHFKNKKNLWNEVKQQIVQNHKKAGPIVPETTLPLKNFLQQLIKNTIQFYIKNPDIQRMIGWQRLEKLPNSALKKTQLSSYLPWVESIKTYQGKNQISHTLNPHYIATLILSLCNGAVSDQNLLFSNDSDMQSYIDFCVETLLNAFSAHT